MSLSLADAGSAILLTSATGVLAFFTGTFVDVPATSTFCLTTSLGFVWNFVLNMLMYVASRCVALRCVALRCVALRCVALRCVALRCVALRCVALRYVALLAHTESHQSHSFTQPPDHPPSLGTLRCFVSIRSVRAPDPDHTTIFSVEDD